jgi:hypothetical protein
MEPDLREECWVSVSVTVELVSPGPLRDLNPGKQNAIPDSSQLIGGNFLQSEHMLW